MAEYIWEIQGTKMPEINFFGHFSSRTPFKKFSNKILLDINITHILKKKN